MSADHHDDPAALLVRNLIEVFNQRDAAERLLTIQSLYSEDAIFSELDDRFHGYTAINQRVTEVLQTLPENASFRPEGEPTRNHNLARLSWSLAPEGGPVLATGMDVAVLDGDRIAALYLFLDPPAATA